LNCTLTRRDLHGQVRTGDCHIGVFICIGDQPALDSGGKRNPDGYGFAAFGRVTKGMEVVTNIHQGATTGDFQRLKSPVLLKRMNRVK